MKKLFIFLLFSLFSLNSALAYTFKSEDSATVNLTGGNTNLKTYAVGSKNTLKTGDHTFVLTGAYKYGESEEIRSVENWNIGLRYDLSFSKKLSFYVGEVIESDRFQGISRRINTDLGARYSHYKDDKGHLFCEVGYRYTIEDDVIDGNEDFKDSKLRVYGEGKKTFKKDLTGKLWAEYLPNFSQDGDFLLNIEPSITVVLSSTFSMKSAYLWRYDNLPVPGNSKQDYNYTLSLLANF